MNIVLRLCYDGSAYHGWQIQKNAVTVCGTLSQAIEKTIGHPVTLYGCGRTDAGVHAKTYVANFRSETRIPLERLPYAINSRLPPDILVQKALAASEDFHAINSCVKKEYTYYLTSQRSPFYHNRALFYPYPADLDKMRYFAGQFAGTHDFAAVRSVGTDVSSTVRTLHYFTIEHGDDGLLLFKMCADGFLYNMARTLVGSVLYGNQGKLTDMRALLESGDRTLAGPTVPAHGLYMTQVWYEEDV